MFEQPAKKDIEEWIDAASALSLLGMGQSLGARMICQHAHAGLIKARASRFIDDGRLSDNADIPREFWWAEGGAALEQNWTIGYFETWIDQRIRLQAFGVTLRRSDLERIGTSTAVVENVDGNPQRPITKASLSPDHGASSMPPPMPIERRRHILAATSILKAYGNTGLDRLLLELGVPEDVGTGSGLAARANSLARYILSNPDAKAVDGSLVGDAIIKRARSLYRGVITNVSQQELLEYEDARANDADEDPKLVAISQRPPTASTAPIIVSTTTPAATGSSDISPVRKKPRRKVFIVHGQDTGPREAVARVLERLDFDPIILHEQANRGRTIITKFQEEAADVGFAVVLMSPDDIGGRQGLAPEKLQARARQNVIFELGFFIGVLGPERVAALMKGTVEKPSDFDGVVYISMDDQGGWMRALSRELVAAGFEVDLNKLP